LSVKTPSIENEYFNTDSNGFMNMQRKFNGKWEGSVFPISSYFFIEDVNSNKKFGFFSKTPLGAISPNKGETVIYLQRSCKEDDKKGVKEILRADSPFFIESDLLFYSNEN